MADRNKQELRGAAGVDRRGLLKCMTWAGTGVVWSLSGGVPGTIGLIGSAAAAETAANELTFVQISDNHIGFHLPPNPDPTATLGEAIAKIKAMPAQPAFIVHTGDISHLSKPEQWDTAEQVIKGANKQVFYIAANGKAYLERFGKNTQGKGWYSFDMAGVHFIALINVFDFQPGFKSAGLAKLGDDQLEWLEKDVTGRSASTPIVVLAHLPLWTIYEQWGWGTADAGRALGYLKRFGSVTVLNGHIHQIIQKVEGNVTFHTADSTAFPQPAPGTAPAPGPMKQVQAGDLRKYLGVRTVDYARSNGAPALTDSSLAG
jgi:3',5'-cyclic AMP phosphodiesterase CpdA